jgi:hypothetical protein
VVGLVDRRRWHFGRCGTQEYQPRLYTKLSLNFDSLAKKSFLGGGELYFHWLSVEVAKRPVNLLESTALGICVRAGRETAGPLRLRSGQALHYATPDFLSKLVALANFMRLSLLKAARVADGECCVAGNPGTLRSHGKPGQAG